MRNNYKNTLVCILIGFCFLWTGSAYLTWLYHLLDFYPTSAVDIYSEVIGYLFQILGLILFSVYIKKKHKPSSTAYASVLVLFADLIFMVFSVLSPNGPCCLIFGYLMNLFHGIVAGIYLTKLTTHVTQQNRGIVFGIGYGVGSIGSWVLSLLGSNNFLKSHYSLILYAIFVLISAIILHVISGSSTDESSSSRQEISFAPTIIVLAAITVFFLSFVKSIGFYFPMADLSDSSVNLELSRAFYAFGLVVAGIVNDKNRKWGAVCCIAALFFPFIMLLLRSNLSSSLVLWILSYVFFGLFSAYRVIVFSDMAGKSSQYLYLAGLGLLFGRCGDVAGTVLGIFLKNDIIPLVFASSVAFAVTVFLFMLLAPKIYVPISPEEKNTETILEEFGRLYQLSPREIEVFRLVIEGCSNAEIADNLFISENTVKFHMKNLLKKTSCTNRSNLIALFKEQ